MKALKMKPQAGGEIRAWPSSIFTRHVRLIINGACMLLTRPDAKKLANYLLKSTAPKGK